MLEAVKGLVIRSCDIGESDRLITIFTHELGNITALARGVRSLKNRNMSSTLQFCYSSFVLYKRGDKLWVKEASLIESFFNLRNSIEGLSLAGYIAEVLADITTASPEVDLLRLSLNSLYAISENKYPLPIIKAAFEIRALSIIGYMPNVLGCRDCNCKEGDFYFDIMSGDIQCYSCREKVLGRSIEENDILSARIIRIISEGARIAICYCIYSPLERLFSFNLKEEDMKLFASAAEDYLVNQLERSFKSLEFYKEVMR
jgi:DNA repair protein RecO (recombination protein O)